MMAGKARPNSRLAIGVSARNILKVFGFAARVGGAIGEGAQVVAALHFYLGDSAKPAL